MEYAEKYIDLLDQGIIKYIVIYDPKATIPSRKGIMSWKDFMKIGEKLGSFKPVEERMTRVKPGNCATLVYTSGTTGMPKGVMISHDNLTWTYQSMNAYQQR